MLGLSIGIKRPRNYNNNTINNKSPPPPLFNPLDCGNLEEGERCVLRPKVKGEVYKSFVYDIFLEGEKEPIKVRKLVTKLQHKLNEEPDILGFKWIRNEASVYMQLKKFDNYRNYCLPFIDFTDKDTFRYIDFEYVKGQTLQDYIHEQKFSRIGKGICLNKCILSLLFLANHGYIHGDIKLDNFYYDTENANVYIFDFEKTKKLPPVYVKDINSTSLFHELSRFLNLLKFKHEFGFSAEEVTHLLNGLNELIKMAEKTSIPLHKNDEDELSPGLEGDIQKFILTSPNPTEGIKRMISLYKLVSKNATTIGSLKKGGGKRTRTRKNRSRK